MHELPKIIIVLYGQYCEKKTNKTYIIKGNNIITTRT